MQKVVRSMLDVQMTESISTRRHSKCGNIFHCVCLKNQRHVTNDSVWSQCQCHSQFNHMFCTSWSNLKTGQYITAAAKNAHERRVGFRTIGMAIKMHERCSMHERDSESSLKEGVVVLSYRLGTYKRTALRRRHTKDLFFSFSFTIISALNSWPDYP